MKDLLGEDESFDDILAYTSLIHIQKPNITNIIKKIKGWLKPNGAFFIGIKEGDSSGYDDGRFVVHYNEIKSEEILRDNGFKFSIAPTKTKTEKACYLNYLCIK